MGGAAGKGSAPGPERNGAVIAIMAAVAALPTGGILAAVALVMLLGGIVLTVLASVFWPIVLVCKIFSCGGGAGAGGSGGGGPSNVGQIVQSDGKGPLYDPSVPSDVLGPIKKAGGLCPQIGPILIAAQIREVSDFQEKLVGPDGRKGISQLPPDAFEEFGKDDDGNGKTSALDTEDSIMAQGRYLCSLAGKVDTLLADGDVKGKALDLTLVAYDQGLDAVKRAKGVPSGSKGYTYVYGVRSGFILYSGAIQQPGGTDGPPRGPGGGPTDPVPPPKGPGGGPAVS